MRAFKKRVKNSEWRGFHCDRSSHFFIPFVSWFYLGYTIRVTKSETLYLKYKYKKARPVATAVIQWVHLFAQVIVSIV